MDGFWVYGICCVVCFIWLLVEFRWAIEGGKVRMTCPVCALVGALLCCAMLSLAWPLVAIFYCGATHWGTVADESYREAE